MAKNILQIIIETIARGSGAKATATDIDKLGKITGKVNQMLGVFGLALGAKEVVDFSMAAAAVACPRRRAVHLRPPSTPPLDSTIGGSTIGCGPGQTWGLDIGPLQRSESKRGHCNSLFRRRNKSILSALQQSESRRGDCNPTARARRVNPSQIIENWIRSNFQ